MRACVRERAITRVSVCVRVCERACVCAYMRACLRVCVGASVRECVSDRLVRGWSRECESARVRVCVRLVASKSCEKDDCTRGPCPGSHECPLSDVLRKSKIPKKNFRPNGHFSQTLATLQDPNTKENYTYTFNRLLISKDSILIFLCSTAPPACPQNAG